MKFHLKRFSTYNWDPEAINNYLKELQDKGLVKSLEHGLAYTRVVQDDTDIKVCFIHLLDSCVSSVQLHLLSECIFFSKNK